MNHMMSDEELDALFSEHEQPDQPEQPQQARVAQEHPPPQQPQIPIYPLSLAGQGSQQSSNGQGEPIFKRKLGGVPVWAWGIIVAGVGGTGYFFYQNRKQAKQSAQPSESSSGGDAVEANPAPQLPENTGGSGGWSPSRSKVAEQLNRYFQRKGASDKVVVWHDADEAKERGKLKHVSPLVNIQVKGDFKVDKDFERFCRREGLNPVQHQDKSIGLYPTESKRGKEWERYIDALRDDGQKV